MASIKPSDGAPRDTAGGASKQPTERHLSVVRHAMGLVESGPGAFQNGRYVVDPADSDAIALVAEVVQLGLMEEGAFGDDSDLPAYRVTRAGVAAVADAEAHTTDAPSGGAR